MSLIQCLECKSNISSLAESCPHCGIPINKDGKLVTIQKTNKEWKAFHLASYIFLFLSLMSLQFNQALMGLFLFFAFVTWVIAKFGKWWNND